METAGELLFVVVIVLLVARAARTPISESRSRKRRLIVVIVVLAVGIAALSPLLILERLDAGHDDSLFCSHDDTASSQRTSHWQWVPPGEVCNNNGTEVGPSAWRGLTMTSVVVVAFAVVLLWPTKRRQGITLLSPHDASATP